MDLFKNKENKNFKGIFLIFRKFKRKVFCLTGISFLNHSLSQQFTILKPYNLLPFEIRLFYKLKIFCYNIFNNRILSCFKKDTVFNNLGYLRHTYDVKIPFDELSLVWHD